jgi:hypothetical protein
VSIGAEILVLNEAVAEFPVLVNGGYTASCCASEKGVGGINIEGINIEGINIEGPGPSSKALLVTIVAVVVALLGKAICPCPNMSIVGGTDIRRLESWPNPRSLPLRGRKFPSVAIVVNCSS